MDVYEVNIQSDDSLDKLNFRILVRDYFWNIEIIGDTWDPTASIKTMKYFLVDSINN